MAMQDMGHRRLIDQHNQVILVYRQHEFLGQPSTPRAHALEAAGQIHLPLDGEYFCQALLSTDTGNFIWSPWTTFRFSNLSQPKHTRGDQERDDHWQQPESE